MSIEKIRKGLRNPRAVPSYLWGNTVKQLWIGSKLGLFSRYPVGTNIFELSPEWDALIILDTCRVDALREVAPEYEFLEAVDSYHSVGGATLDWMCNTFTKKHRAEVERTAYVCGNGWSKRILRGDFRPEDHCLNPVFRHLTPTRWSVLSESDFLLLDHVVDYGSVTYGDDSIDWIPDVDSIPFPEAYHPRYVTDRAISIGRSTNADRLVIHYSQPHIPWLSEAVAMQRDPLPEERDPWDFLRGGGSRSVAWERYLDELRFGLDDVRLLLENLDAETVVITADHGEAFGEWSFYDHKSGSLHPAVRRVPLVTTTASDKGSYESRIDPDDAADRDVTANLNAMGYLD